MEQCGLLKDWCHETIHENYLRRLASVYLFFLVFILFYSIGDMICLDHLGMAQIRLTRNIVIDGLCERNVDKKRKVQNQELHETSGFIHFSMFHRLASA